MEIKDYNVQIDERNFFGWPINNDLKTYDNIGKIAADNYTNWFLCFKKYYKLIALDLSKQQKLNADPKTIQQINFSRIKFSK